MAVEILVSLKADLVTQTRQVRTMNDIEGFESGRKQVLRCKQIRLSATCELTLIKEHKLRIYTCFQNITLITLVIVLTLITFKPPNLNNHNAL